MEFLWKVFTSIFCIPCRIYKWIYSTFFIMDISQKGPIFITGCDTGFGQLLALKLVKNGISTFAGCLTENGEKQLRKAAGQSAGKLWTVRLDVTSQESVDEAVDFVVETLGLGKGLWGLVNNAGVLGYYASDDWLNVDHYQKTMDVNFFGVVRVTQAFKPLLKLEHGRLVVVTSVYGRIVGGPNVGPYCASKYAAEAYCDVVRRELKPFGVTVHILEPGFFATNITQVDWIEKMQLELWKATSSSVKEEYGEEYLNGALSHLRKVLPGLCNGRVHLVVDAYYDALTSRCPKMRYHIGTDAVMFFIPVSFFPTRLQDFVLNTILKLTGYPKPKAVK